MKTSSSVSFPKARRRCGIKPAVYLAQRAPSNSTAVSNLWASEPSPLYLQRLIAQQLLVVPALNTVHVAVMIATMAVGVVVMVITTMTTTNTRR